MLVGVQRVAEAVEPLRSADFTTACVRKSPADRNCQRMVELASCSKLALTSLDEKAAVLHPGMRRVTGADDTVSLDHHIA